ncbi:hypothetical protein IJ162_02890 [Candidatus Saccharibacteria bacterium]|nr:hypothetical protein [Candidatus Saccharibacteria bacterium]
MTEAQEKAKKEYLEVLGYGGEIEFNYNGFFYHIEPDYKKEDTYNIWKFADEYEGGGEMIATCSPAVSILEEKAFDGKTILEIEDDMTGCALR